MKDDLSNRMKDFYENRTKTFLPRRTFTIIRIDGKAFHTYTRGLERPFDLGFMEDMDKTAAYLCENIQGAKFAFVQSDEISILLTDFDNLQTDAWFNGNIQKMTSVSASLATAKFNHLRSIRTIKGEFHDLSCLNPVRKIASLYELKLAHFDSRVFTIPYIEEVINYFIWRQIDTVRNSISSVAQNLYSSKELHQKNTNQMQEMCFQKGINWNDLDSKVKRGRVICKQEYLKESAKRTRWISLAAVEFTKNKEIFKEFDYEI